MQHFVFVLAMMSFQIVVVWVMTLLSCRWIPEFGKSVFSPPTGHRTVSRGKRRSPVCVSRNEGKWNCDEQSSHITGWVAHKTKILPVVLYGCETLCLTLREEQRENVAEQNI
jgi:hypothetical protein